MSQRNPLNDRYNTDEARTGKTRKSAASAKPATKAASSVRVPSKAEEPKGLFARATAEANKSTAVKNSKKKAASKQSAERRREREIRAQHYNPQTPEYKKWKRVWWGMLGAALATTALSFWLTTQPDLVNWGYVCIGLSYALLFAAIVFDFTYLRRLRNEYQEQMILEEKSKKKSALRKEAAAQARREAKEAAENPQPEEDRKLFRGLFTKKRATDAVETAKDAQLRAEAAAEKAAAAKSAEAAEAADAAKPGA